MASSNTSVAETDKPQPYVSKWQKLAQILNEDEEADLKKEGQLKP